MMTGPTNYGPIMMGGLHKSMVGWGWWAEGWGSRRRSGWAFTEQAATERRDAALAAMKPKADEIVDELRERHVDAAIEDLLRPR